MASWFSLNIPFTVLAGKTIIQGTASGSVLMPYEVYEVRLNDGTIFNLEAVPFGKGYHWYSIQSNDIASSIGKEIERFFQGLKEQKVKALALN